MTQRIVVLVDGSEHAAAALLGSVSSSHVIEHAPCPVVVVRS